jgi:hypothetical protein
LRPIQYDALSPVTAPAAAKRMTRPSTRSPVEASTPARMTEVSLGTSGMMASRAAIAKRKRYVQGEPETYSVSDSNMPATG